MGDVLRSRASVGDMNKRSGSCPRRRTSLNHCPSPDPVPNSCGRCPRKTREEDRPPAPSPEAGLAEGAQARAQAGGVIR